MAKVAWSKNASDTIEGKGCTFSLAATSFIVVVAVFLYVIIVGPWWAHSVKTNDGESTATKPPTDVAPTETEPTAQPDQTATSSSNHSITNIFRQFFSTPNPERNQNSPSGTDPSPADPSHTKSPPDKSPETKSPPDKSPETKSPPEKPPETK